MTSIYKTVTSDNPAYTFDAGLMIDADDLDDILVHLETTVDAGDFGREDGSTSWWPA